MRTATRTASSELPGLRRGPRGAGRGDPGGRRLPRRVVANSECRLVPHVSFASRA